MNRTDRLVAMVLFLQGRRLARAEDLAAHFAVTPRTIYRDIAALGEAGVPISGEAGVGYSLVKGYYLPPVLFTAEEAAALFVGAEMVKRFADASFHAPAALALLKIRSLLPRDRQDELERLEQTTVIASPPRFPASFDQRTLLPIQQALVARQVLRLVYRARERDHDTTRDIEPMGVFFAGGAWYLVAWCRLRGEVRHFRLDRIRKLELSAERFAPRQDFSLRRHLDAVKADSPKFEVRIRFASSALERARIESYTGVLEETASPGGAELRLHTYSLDWCARWVLSFGPAAEALAPTELRAQVLMSARDLARRHARSGTHRAAQKSPDRTLSGARVTLAPLASVQPQTPHHPTP